MTDESRTILIKNLGFFLTLERAGFINGLNNMQKDEILTVARQEFFGPQYSPDLWCPTCIAEFIKQTYERFYLWLKQQTGQNDICKDKTEGIELMNKIIEDGKHTV
ncbi:MAG: hypothetical protein QM791_04170 [Ferruginibacter sp.]